MQEESAQLIAEVCHEHQMEPEPSPGGSVPSLPMIGSPLTPPGSPSLSNTSVAKKRKGPADTCTGKCVCACGRSEEEGLFETFSEEELMLSPQDLKQLEITCGKKTPVLKERSLKRVNSLRDVTTVKTGKKSGSPPRKETTTRYLRKFEWVITGVSEQLRPTLVTALEWSEAALSSGAELVQESQCELGKSPAWTLILRTRGLSFGMATEVKKMLSSMNFEEQSTSRTCYGGWIDIRCVLKLKGHLHPWPRGEFGSRPTSPQKPGTLA
jgi:hypothetical protein